MSQPRRLVIAYTIPVVFEIPEGFPLTADEIQKIVDWKLGDGRDGRYPFSSELMADGASRAAQHHVEDAIFHHYCRRVEETFGRSGDHLEARNKLVDRCSATVQQYGQSEYAIRAKARIYGRTVICPGCQQETLVSKYKHCVCGAELEEVAKNQAWTLRRFKAGQVVVAQTNFVYVTGQRVLKGTSGRVKRMEDGGVPVVRVWWDTLPGGEALATSCEFVDLDPPGNEQDWDHAREVEKS